MLLFDVDLTLINTGGAGIRALNQATGDVLGVRDVMERVAPHGKTDPAIVREICADVRPYNTLDIESVTTTILEKYLMYLEGEVSRSERYRVLPGILELLDDLRMRPDIRVGLATGNLERGARVKLERGGLNPYFEFGGFGSDSEDRIEVVRQAASSGNNVDGSPVTSADTFVIGDTPKDIAAGRGAGFQTVGVATGSYSLEELAGTGADIVIEDFVVGRDQFMRSTRIL